MDTLLVFTTLPDTAAAEQLATRLVEAGLAACVTIGGEVISVYRWRGETRRGTEIVLTIKTPAAHYAALQRAIVDAHPYELPEIIAVPITQGLPEYLDWVKQCTND